MADRAIFDDDDDILRLIDLERYPINALDQGPGAAFLQKCREQMATFGWCNLDGFIRPEALQALAVEAKALLPGAEFLTIKRTIYGGKADASVPQDDPRRREYVHQALQLADDQLPAETLIQRLYHSDLLTDFIRRVQDKTALYRYADEFQALNIVALPPGGWHAWHYDYNECTVTLLLQAAESGGEFTFLPDVRNRETENHAMVDQFLAGDMVESGCGAVAVGSAYRLSAPFAWRCLTSRAVASFPHPAHRTGRALLTHPALGQDITPSHAEGHGTALRPTARAVDPQRTPIDSIARNRHCHHQGRQ